MRSLVLITGLALALASSALGGPPAAPGTHVLLVGVGVDSTGSDPLPADRDIANMQAALSRDRSRWPLDRIQEIQDQDATKTRIRKALTDLAAAAAPGETVLYYHSSHGHPARRADGTLDTKNVYLFAYDGAYWGDELAEDLAAFDWRVTVIVILDTCYSGGVPFARCSRCAVHWDEDANGRARWKPAPKEFFDDLTRNPSAASSIVLPGNVAWLTASAHDRKSHVLPTVDDPVGRSLFTLRLKWGFTLADGNDDGVVTFFELFVYARDEMRELWDRMDSHPEPRCFNEPLLRKTVARRFR